MSIKQKETWRECQLRRMEMGLPFLKLSEQPVWLQEIWKRA